MVSHAMRVHQRCHDRSTVVSIPSPFTHCSLGTEGKMAPKTPMRCLRVEGTDIVDADGKQVILKGVSVNYSRVCWEIPLTINSVPLAVTPTWRTSSLATLVMRMR